MNTSTPLTVLLCLATATLSAADETTISLAPAATQAPELEEYTAPLSAMLNVVKQINEQLASVKDEDSAELAGEEIQGLLGALNTHAETFSQQPALKPELEEQFMAWWAEQEYIMEELVMHCERLQNEDPAFFGSQTLIAAIIMVGGVMGGAQ